MGIYGENRRVREAAPCGVFLSGTMVISRPRGRPHGAAPTHTGILCVPLSVGRDDPARPSVGADSIRPPLRCRETRPGGGKPPPYGGLLSPVIARQSADWPGDPFPTPPVGATLVVARPHSIRP